MTQLATPQPIQATARGRYLYAVVDGSPDGSIYDFQGLDGAPVYTIGDATLAAIVSDLPNQKIRPERRRLAAHHAVLRSLMGGHTVLPMAFGVVADGPEAVRRILRVHQDAFIEQLERVRGRVEMGLRVAWDVANIFEYVLGLHDDLRTLRDFVFRGGRTPSQDDKIELGRAFDRLLSADREEHLAHLTTALQPHSLEIQSNPPRSEREVLNLACLVDQDELPAFEHAVMQAARRFDNNFTFDLTGPWPPHNFVELALALS